MMMTTKVVVMISASKLDDAAAIYLSMYYAGCYQMGTRTMGDAESRLWSAVDRDALEPSTGGVDETRCCRARKNGVLQAAYNNLRASRGG